MSRNYELLTQLAEQEVAIQPPVPVPAPAVAAGQLRVAEEKAGEEGAKRVQRLFVVAGGRAPNTSLQVSRARDTVLSLRNASYAPMLRGGESWGTNPPHPVPPPR